LLIQNQTQAQQQRIDPKLIMANTLLQLSGVELQQTIEQELTENPALEMEDDEPCSGCELAPVMCKDCQYYKEQRQAVSSDDLSVHELEYSFDFTSDPDDENDPISGLRAELSLKEHLREQLRNTASPRLYEIGEYLINYITESGYLDCDLLEITLELDATDEELAQAVALIQTLDPPGVGARDLRECMQIQLKHLSEDGKGNWIAERIVGDCWDEMVARKVTRMARRLKVRLDQVKYALSFIQSKLSPYPAAGFRAPWDYKPSDSKIAVRPDVIVRRTPAGYEIEVIAGHSSLAVTPYYRQIYNELRNGRPRRYSDEDKKHIMEYVDRADLFIRNVNQRRKTLRMIAKSLVEHQQGYLETGSKLFVRPLTRVKVAEALGVHESTVSRATANKYIQLPSQEVVPFDFFFQGSTSLMDMIARLMSSEEVDHPLSDKEIAAVLTEQGYTIARRTVAKYRKAQKILSSRHRRH
jgi:RNA polymerase sigma-54 factor